MANPSLVPFVPHMKATLSYASPEKAAQIRSAVTGALKRDDRTGLFCFEHTVETTFVLPWDLHPNAEPQKLSVAARDRIRTELLDEAALGHLESCAAINWGSNLVKWQCRLATGVHEWTPADHVIAAQLETSYYCGSSQVTFVAAFVSFQVDHDTRQLYNTRTGDLFEVRRLGPAPLMPMKVESPPSSHRESVPASNLFSSLTFVCSLPSSSSPPPLLPSSPPPLLPLMFPRQRRMYALSSTLPPWGCGGSTTGPLSCCSLWSTRWLTPRPCSPSMTAGVQRSPALLHQRPKL